ncbi:MAG: cytochrome c biogenesis protein ResB [Chloroflexota bacterium]|nr:cytochrome c biogenesis protein ResB [Chloroflexota bacterium]
MRAARTITGRRHRAGAGAIDGLWRILSSPRIAAVNLLLLAGALMLVALLPQAPSDTPPGSATYAAWLEDLQPALGPLAPMLDALGGFRLLDAGWFRFLLGWLGVSLGVYVFGHAASVAHRPKETREHGPETMARPDFSLHSHLSNLEAERVIREALVSLGYRFQTIGPGTLFYAERHRAQRAARVLSHLGAGLLLLAASVGAIIGWQEPMLAVAEGSTVPVGHGTNLSLKNEGFSSALYSNGRSARDYVTTLTVLHEGRPVVRGASLRVNSPVTYGGIRIHQAFFGPAVDLQVWDAAGRLLQGGGVPLVAEDPDLRPAAVLLRDTYRLEILAPRADGTDRIVPPGSLRARVYRAGTGQSIPLAEINLQQGERAVAGGLTMLFERETQYSGLHVTYNPAAPWAWAAAALMLGGVVYTFACPYRSLLFSVTPLDSGSLLRIQSVAGRAMGRTAELARVDAAIRHALGSRGPTQAKEAEGGCSGGIA